MHIKTTTHSHPWKVIPFLREFKSWLFDDQKLRDVLVLLILTVSHDTLTVPRWQVRQRVWSYLASTYAIYVLNCRAQECTVRIEVATGLYSSCSTANRGLLTTKPCRYVIIYYIKAALFNHFEIHNCCVFIPL